MRVYIFFCFVLFIVAVNMTSEVDAKRASEFTRYCLKIQQDIAQRVAAATGHDRVYVYDTAGYFYDADNKTTADCLRYKEKCGRIAVLSESAQTVLKNPNEYQQFSSQRNPIDVVGVYLLKN
ncbi:hypothetical protein [Erysiphe necator associated virga-like virus 1]|nr:hypothetical protein [Erysiphe necator associated virga-like virus 1]